MLIDRPPAIRAILKSRGHNLLPDSYPRFGNFGKRKTDRRVHAALSVWILASVGIPWAAHPVAATGAGRCPQAASCVSATDFTFLGDADCNRFLDLSDLDLLAASLFCDRCSNCATKDVNKDGRRSVADLLSTLGLLTGALNVTVQIDSPVPLAFFSERLIQVSGVAAGASEVSCNDVRGGLIRDWFMVDVLLREGNNTITCVAFQGARALATASVQVTLDTTAPRVTIDSPPTGYVTDQSRITVTGMINDIVVGTVNGEQATVMVNGAAAQVANRSFLATDVPLTPGANTIAAIGRDRAGNEASAVINVELRPTMAEPMIRMVSGYNQTAVIGSDLPAPLVVELVDAAGRPVADKIVIFKVMENNGSLRAGGPASRSVAVTTGTEGRAEALWTVGTRAGAGNNVVEVKAVGFASMAAFSAIALPTAANQINVDAGNNQVGVVSQPLPKPFVVVVTDAGHNRLSGVPVSFTVVEGGGTFDGAAAVTLNTDSDGRALAVLTLGAAAGIENNVVHATFPGNPTLGASFRASGRLAGDPSQTRITGVVLDNTDRPVAGVTMGIGGHCASTFRGSPTVVTDAQGQFALPAPVGNVFLAADGGTVKQGTWPCLEYELVTVSGQDNTIGMPIRMLPLADDPKAPNVLHVSETTGGTITLPDMPGFSLTIAPGSVTFPNESKDGVVSVTLVHADKMPMPPGFGQQPRFLITIQPPGTLFNPPAPLCMPNVDGLDPGETTEMYSFDHDMGQFVSIGPGSVSRDGTTFCSKSGVGVSKGGWHCGGNPTIGQCLHQCPECQLCDNNCICRPDNLARPHQNASNDCVQQVCLDGTVQTVSDDSEGCEDGNVCTGSGFCSSGRCMPGSPLPAGNPCEVDQAECRAFECDGAGSCQFVGGLAQGTPCGVNLNSCSNHLCNNFGDCQDFGTGLTCERDSDVCTVDRCGVLQGDSTAGCHTIKLQDDRTPCAEDDASCSTNECITGVCTSVVDARTDGRRCDRDGDICSVDRCKAGACTATAEQCMETVNGASQFCACQSDRDPCTRDYCLTTVCTNEGIGSCQDSDNDGVNDQADDDPNDRTVCQDLDRDYCDDCSGGTGQPDPLNDGSDPDRDGVCDPTDNCPTKSNPDQEDSNGDMRGDACSTCEGSDVQRSRQEFDSALRRAEENLARALGRVTRVTAKFEDQTGAVVQFNIEISLAAAELNVEMIIKIAGVTSRFVATFSGVLSIASWIESLANLYFAVQATNSLRSTIDGALRLLDDARINLTEATSLVNELRRAGCNLDQFNQLASLEARLEFVSSQLMSMLSN